VTITFELQKREGRNDAITQHRSNDPIICPVKIWAKVIQRLISYKSTSRDTTVNTYQFPDSSLHLFSGKELLLRIRAAASVIGEAELGFNPKKLGLHSARSGAAMAMYLGRVPVVTIMLLGRWASDAFLRYIRKQVQEFSKGVSQRMVSHERFFTISADVITNDSVEPDIFSNKFGHNFKDTVRPLVSVFR
jgi:hypothetical protein